MRMKPRRVVSTLLMLAGVAVILSHWTAGNGWWRTGTAAGLLAVALAVDRVGRPVKS